MFGRNKVCPEVRETARMSKTKIICVTIAFDLLMAFDLFIADDSSTMGTSFEIFLSSVAFWDFEVDAGMNRDKKYVLQ